MNEEDSEQPERVEAEEINGFDGEPIPLETPPPPPGIERHPPKRSERQRGQHNSILIGIAAALASLLAVLAISIFALRSNENPPTAVDVTTSQPAAATSNPASVGIVQLVGIEPGASLTDGDAMAVSAQMDGGEVAGLALLIDGVIVGETQGNNPVTYIARPGDSSASLVVTLESGELVTSTPIGISVQTTTTTPPATLAPTPTVAATSPPTPQKEAADLAQELATALASDDWATAARLDRSKATWSTSQWNTGYGNLEDSTAVVLSSRPLGGSRYWLRILLVAHEIQNGVRLTLPFCVTWIPDISSRTVDVNSEAGSAVRLPSRSGWVDPSVLQPLLQDEC